MRWSFRPWRHRFDGAGPVIALNAHGDVVPPGEGWTRPPYEGVAILGALYAEGDALRATQVVAATVYDLLGGR